MNWEVVSALCGVVALGASLLNVWLQAQLRTAVLGMQVTISALKLEVFKEAKTEAEGLRSQISTLEIEAATLAVRMTALESARSLRPRAA